MASLYPRAEEILTRLRSAGGRVTPARRAVVNALVSHAGHPTAEDLTAAVQADQPDVHQSTVYRILEDLERLGEVHHTHLGHGPAVYHLAHASHPHLVCEQCARVVELDTATFDAFAAGVARQHGFVTNAGHFAVTGLCAACATRRDN
jgi:Fur family ferric uptake transcriptional regulator